MKNYKFYQKILHRLFLSSKIFKKSFFELEKIFFLKENFSIKESKHIFISGLPRSGTTIILNYIYNTGQFSSLTYNDMPFVMAPNLFSFQKRFNNEKIERFHGDNIYINFNSPEALDEIFFSSFTENEIENEIENYVNLIVKKYKQIRYLSKNNLNYKRIDILRKIFSNSFFLIPFRDPIQQANSLLNQHKNFLKLQEEDRFVLEYMNYLNHREFGKNHIYWNKPNYFFDCLDINYWLEQWSLFYDRILLDLDKKNVHFICYEELTNDSYIQKLNNKFELQNLSNFNFFVKKENLFFNKIDQTIKQKSYKTYDKLKILAINE